MITLPCEGGRLGYQPCFSKKTSLVPSFIALFKPYCDFVRASSQALLSSAGSSPFSKYSTIGANWGSFRCKVDKVGSPPFADSQEGLVAATTFNSVSCHHMVCFEFLQKQCHACVGFGYVCVRACGLTPQCPSFVLIIPHLLSVGGHQLHYLWCPWRHLWYVPYVIILGYALTHEHTWMSRSHTRPSAKQWKWWL